MLRAVGLQEPYSWATHNGAELDLLLVQSGRRYGVECTFNEAPTVTASIRIARKDLALDHLWVVYPGTVAYPVDETITVLPLREVARLARRVGRRHARGG